MRQKDGDTLLSISDYVRAAQRLQAQHSPLYAFLMTDDAAIAGVLQQHMQRNTSFIANTWFTLHTVNRTLLPQQPLHIHDPRKQLQLQYQMSLAQRMQYNSNITADSKSQLLYELYRDLFTMASTRAFVGTMSSSIGCVAYALMLQQHFNNSSSFAQLNHGSSSVPLLPSVSLSSHRCPILPLIAHSPRS